MRLFGYEITFAKATRPLSGVDDSRGWTRIFDWRPGAWQQDAAMEVTDVFAQSTVYSCITLIASDIGKLRARLVEKRGRVWVETESPAYGPVLRKPNHYQTRQKFIESWIISKLSDGNTYGLKVRDNRKVVKAIYVLDPRRVQPLVAPDGAVYYRLGEDDLNKLPAGLEAVPASEIIHDRLECLFHPLVGVTPLYAATLPAQQALKIQTNSKSFFANRSMPGGILTAPGRINEETAKRIKEYWERNYTGENAGRVAVLGDALTYTPGAVNAVDSQLVEQLKLTALQICSAFHVPAFMVGAADAPPYGNIGAAIQQYYNQCLQKHIEAFEACMDDGLGIGEGVKIEGRELGVDLDLDALMRMDSKTMAEVEAIKIKGISSPNESREKFGLEPVDGGESPMAQQQNYSLAALQRRDEGEDPFGTAKPPAPPAPTAPPVTEGEERSVAIARIGVVAEDAKTAAVSAAAAVSQAIAKCEAVESAVADVSKAQKEQAEALARLATDSAAATEAVQRSFSEAVAMVAEQQAAAEQRAAEALAASMIKVGDMFQRSIDAVQAVRESKEAETTDAEFDAFVSKFALHIERAEPPILVQ